MYVKPAPGLVIRDPDLLDLLPDAGREVPDSGYWQRRLRDRDVIASEPAEPPADTHPADTALQEQLVEAPAHDDPQKGDD